MHEFLGVKYSPLQEQNWVNATFAANSELNWFSLIIYEKIRGDLILENVEAKNFEGS